MAYSSHFTSELNKPQSQKPSATGAIHVYPCRFLALKYNDYDSADKKTSRDLRIPLGLQCLGVRSGSHRPGHSYSAVQNPLSAACLPVTSQSHFLPPPQVGLQV